MKLIFFIVLLSSAPAWANRLSSFSAVMGGMGLVSSQATVLNLNGSMAPEKNPSVIEQSRLNLSVPVMKKGGESLSLGVTAGQVAFNERRLFDNGEDTPTELNRLEVGSSFSRVTDNSVFGLRGSFGSASDEVFYSDKEMTFTLSSFYGRLKEQDAHWLWTVFLSNNNPLASYVPIPGFIYLYQKQGFIGMFGLPFMSIQWKPRSRLTLSSSFFITNYNAEVSWSLTDATHVFTGFSVNQQSFLRKDRDDARSRLFFNEKRIFVGTKSTLTKHISGDVQFGQSFDRSLKEGRRFNDIDIEEDYNRSWYGSFNLVFLIP